jgi:phage terminase Nu1 subunit (DNA packaging protein)
MGKITDKLGKCDMHISRRKFAEFFDITPTTVSKLIREGMPATKIHPDKPQSHIRIPLQTAIEWIYDRNVEIIEQRREKTEEDRRAEAYDKLIAKRFREEMGFLEDC